MNQCSKWVEDTHNLHVKMDDMEGKLAIHSNNPALLAEFLRIRRDFIQEEANEIDQAIQEQDPDKIVDAFIDGIVVGVDTLTLMGVDVDEAWNRVYAANITKSPGVNPNRPNPFGLPDLIKPADFKAPTHEGNLGYFANIFPKK